VEKVIQKFNKAGVDGVFFPHCNFGSEHCVGKVAKAIGKPVLLWGPRDDAPLPNGDRSRDTQCGLFATGKVLRRFNVPFTYVVNSTVSDQVFEKGYKNFVAVCSVVKAIGKLRILQIAPRPDAFWTVICNEGELLEKFGIQVFPVTMSDFVIEVEKQKQSAKSAVFMEDYKSASSLIDFGKLKEEEKINIIAMKTAMKKMCARFGCSAVALQCWNVLQDLLHVMPCLSNGLLTDEGIPTVCETDIHGAVSSILLQEASMRRSSTFFADLTIRHPTNDNAELLWHCGNFPPSIIKKEQKAYVDYNFIMPSHCPGVGVWEIKGGDITVCRFDGDHGEYKLLIGEGIGVEGPATKGTYVWFEVNDWPMWEERLVTGPYIHHCAGVHGRHAAVLYEACKYIPGLIADPVSPTEEEIQKYWRSNEG
jgi:L-fucose isomerase-like protein